MRAEVGEDMVAETMDVAVAGVVVVVVMRRLLTSLQQSGRSYLMRSATESAKNVTRKANRAEQNDLSTK